MAHLWIFGGIAAVFTGYYFGNREFIEDTKPRAQELLAFKELSYEQLANAKITQVRERQTVCSENIALHKSRKPQPKTQSNQNIFKKWEVHLEDGTRFLLECFTPPIVGKTMRQMCN